MRWKSSANNGKCWGLDFLSSLCYHRRVTTCECSPVPGLDRAVKTVKLSVHSLITWDMSLCHSVSLYVTLCHCVSSREEQWCSRIVAGGRGKHLFCLHPTDSFNLKCFQKQRTFPFGCMIRVKYDFRLHHHNIRSEWRVETTDQSLNIYLVSV